MTEETERNYPSQAELDEARKRARDKLADDIVAAEFNVQPEMPRKGPLKRKERMYELTLELAPHTDRLIIDSVVYFHGNTYTVPESVYQLIREMIYRGWDHQREIEGKDRNAYRHEKNINLNPLNINRSNDSFLGK